ncbi:MAG: hypothetical protein AAGE05_00810 [Pseudomonadota bacterium]
MLIGAPGTALAMQTTAEDLSAAAAACQVTADDVSLTVEDSVARFATVNPALPRDRFTCFLGMLTDMGLQPDLSAIGLSAVDVSMPVIVGEDGTPFYLAGIAGTGTVEQAELLEAAIVVNGLGGQRIPLDGNRVRVVVSFVNSDPALTNAFVEQARQGAFGTLDYETILIPAAAAEGSTP